MHFSSQPAVPGRLCTAQFMLPGFQGVLFFSPPVVLVCFFFCIVFSTVVICDLLPPSTQDPRRREHTSNIWRLRRMATVTLSTLRGAATAAR